MANQTCPVCGQPVDATCPSVEYRGQTYYLRCIHCVMAFKADPDRYLQAGAPPGCAGEGQHAH